ncbi:MAG: hypothetical protein Q4G24_08155 [Paracoccus sp. (in: a-proteobacteria)]|uniref:hypothetical protein n=1 Tax=Paracoccus sp. TaxID=267 RepID=UPI0026DF1465|nr:hypothetical protein [Paracoccus sp. (in: a-proteobacteria)]MDO5621426.1 hypothetical protein [Paracoccus sp. (in: a-proteobacteria)]
MKPQNFRPDVAHPVPPFGMTPAAAGQVQMPAQPVTPATSTCRDCGTSIPTSETQCALCARKEGSGSTGATTALHWLLFLATMTALLGGGWMLQHM